MIRPVFRFLFLVLLLAWARSAVAGPVVKVVQPYENQKIPFVTSSFVFGSVTPATATLTINGVSVKPYKNGGFLTMIPFQEGSFHIDALVDDGISSTTVSRIVQVASAAHSYPL